MLACYQCLSSQRHSISNLFLSMYMAGGLLTSRLSGTGDGTLSRPQSAGGQSTGGHSSSGTGGGGGSGSTLQVQALHLDVVTCAVNPDIVLR
jgi:hypothetical protein